MVDAQLLTNAFDNFCFTAFIPVPPAPSAHPLEDETADAETQDAISSTPHWSRPIHVHGRTWSAAIVALAATELLAVIYILAIIVMRLLDGTLRGAHHGLGLLLLVALSMLLCSVVLFVLPTGEHDLTCQLKLYLPPVLLVTCYSVLLAKLMYLRHLASAGLGGHVPQFPLYLTVALCVAVQTAVCAHFDPAQCAPSHTDLALLYLFPIILVGVTAVYSAVLVDVRHQHGEAQWILVTTVVATLALAVWAAACGWMLPIEYCDGATASLIVASAAVVVSCVFLPVMTKLHPLRSAKPAAAKMPTTYTCNISVASTIPNPWLDSFDSRFVKSCCEKELQKNTSHPLSGSHLIQHPAYSGRPQQ